jgi:hypothetical protein
MAQDTTHNSADQAASPAPARASVDISSRLDALLAQADAATEDFEAVAQQIGATAREVDSEQLEASITNVASLAGRGDTPEPHNTPKADEAGAVTNQKDSESVLDHTQVTEAQPEGAAEIGDPPAVQAKPAVDLASSLDSLLQSIPAEESVVPGNNAAPQHRDQQPSGDQHEITTPTSMGAATKSADSLEASLDSLLAADTFAGGPSEPSDAAPVEASPEELPDEATETRTRAIASPSQTSSPATSAEPAKRDLQASLDALLHAADEEDVTSGSSQDAEAKGSVADQSVQSGPASTATTPAEMSPARRERELESLDQQLAALSEELVRDDALPVEAPAIASATPVQPDPPPAKATESPAAKPHLKPDLKPDSNSVPAAAAAASKPPAPHRNAESKTPLTTSQPPAEVRSQPQAGEAAHVPSPPSDGLGSAAKPGLITRLAAHAPSPANVSNAIFCLLRPMGAPLAKAPPIVHTLITIASIYTVGLGGYACYYAAFVRPSKFILQTPKAFDIGHDHLSAAPSGEKHDPHAADGHGADAKEADAHGEPPKKAAKKQAPKTKKAPAKKDAKAKPDAKEAAGGH